MRLHRAVASPLLGYNSPEFRDTARHHVAAFGELQTIDCVAADVSPQELTELVDDCALSAAFAQVDAAPCYRPGHAPAVPDRCPVLRADFELLYESHHRAYELHGPDSSAFRDGNRQYVYVFGELQVTGCAALLFASQELAELVDDCVFVAAHTLLDAAPCYQPGQAPTVSDRCPVLTADVDADVDRWLEDFDDNLEARQRAADLHGYNSPEYSDHSRQFVVLVGEVNVADCAAVLGFTPQQWAGMIDFCVSSADIAQVDPALCHPA